MLAGKFAEFFRTICRRHLKALGQEMFCITPGTAAEVQDGTALREASRETGLGGGEVHGDGGCGEGVGVLVVVG